MSTFLTVNDAAVFLGLKKSYLYQLVFHRAIPAYKPRGRLLFDQGELEAYVRKGRIPTFDELSQKADSIINGKSDDCRKKKIARVAKKPFCKIGR
jgi:excisionase family DNA binding protein